MINRVAGLPDLTTCFNNLAAALRVWAKCLLGAEATVELLIGHRWWLCREDFLDVAMEPGWEVFSGQVMVMVAVDSNATKSTGLA